MGDHEQWRSGPAIPNHLHEPLQVAHQVGEREVPALPRRAAVASLVERRHVVAAPDCVRQPLVVLGEVLAETVHEDQDPAGLSGVADVEVDQRAVSAAEEALLGAERHRSPSPGPSCRHRSASVAAVALRRTSLRPPG